MLKMIKPLLVTGVVAAGLLVARSSSATPTPTPTPTPNGGTPPTGGGNPPGGGMPTGTGTPPPVGMTPANVVVLSQLRVGQMLWVRGNTPFVHQPSDTSPLIQTLHVNDHVMVNSVQPDGWIAVYFPARLSTPTNPSTIGWIRAENLSTQLLADAVPRPGANLPPPAAAPLNSINCGPLTTSLPEAALSRARALLALPNVAVPGQPVATSDTIAEMLRLADAIAYCGSALSTPDPNRDDYVNRLRTRASFLQRNLPHSPTSPVLGGEQ
jgi:hypothetical protein